MTNTTMTTEAAIYCLRREPQTAMQARSCKAALEALGRAGVQTWEIEGDIMRPLTDAEAAILGSARS